MTGKEFLNRLGITKEGIESDDGIYTVTLDSSNEFSRAYTILDKAKNVDLDSESVVMTEENVLMTYLADDFDILLKADLKNKRYSIEISEVVE